MSDLTPVDLKQIDRKIEEAAYVFKAIHDLASEHGKDGDPVIEAIPHMAARGLQMLDACMGRIAGNNVPTLGNFHPDLELERFGGKCMRSLDYPEDEDGQAEVQS